MSLGRRASKAEKGDFSSEIEAFGESGTSRAVK